MLRTAKLVSTAIVARGRCCLGQHLLSEALLSLAVLSILGFSAVTAAPVKMAGRLFTFFAYGSPVAQLHWYVMATRIRCHAVEMLLTNRDTKLLGNLVLDLNKMKLPAGPGPADGMGGGPFPVCMKDYARNANLITRVGPLFTEHRVNPVPVRIIIDTKETVKHFIF